MQYVLGSLFDECREDLDANNIVGTIFMDLSKAFDLVDHPTLLCKRRMEISRLILLVHIIKCIRNEAPNQLCHLFKTNRQIGNCRTRGKDNSIIYPM